jgi:hypothetical protein
MSEGRVLAGVHIDAAAPVTRCKVCGAPMWWGLTKAGKRCPFDVTGGVRTAVTHFSTCPEVRQFERGRGKA